MGSISEVEEKFFAACETGKGCEGCRDYCHHGATFSAQADPWAEVKTIEGYTEFMKGLYTPLPDGKYERQAFAVDEDRNTLWVLLFFAVLIVAKVDQFPLPGKKQA